MLRALATDPAARGLADDAAVLEVGGAQLVITSDTIVAGVHFLADDPPEDIGWKLAEVHLSDLAAKGARPLDWKSVVEGKGVAVRLDPGGRRKLKKKNEQK